MSLACERLTAGYGRVQIVNDVSLRVEPGECVAVLGKNGMGKTTLLRAVTGLVDRFDGRVEVCGEDVSRAPTHRIIRAGVSYVPQDEPIFEGLTVEENLQLGAVRRTGGHGRSAEARDEMLERFPRLRDRAKQKAGTLSGGEQKMLMIARAFLSRPRLALIDEVSEGLSPVLRDTLVEVLRRSCKDWGTAVVLVEQNLDFALEIAERFAVLSGGRIVETGSVDDEQAVGRIEQHMIL